MKPEYSKPRKTRKSTKTYGPEYIVCKDVSRYLKLQYPKVWYLFDLTGLGLTKTQAGMNKEIQKGNGRSDLFIFEPRGPYHGLIIEIKKDGVRIFKRDGITGATPHIIEQTEFLELMIHRGYYATFACGFDACKKVIDDYMRLPVFKVSIA